MKFVTVTICALLLAGCGSTASTEDTPETRVFEKQLPDGRTVTCVTYDDANFGTELSCDWANAK